MDNAPTPESLKHQASVPSRSLLRSEGLNGPEPLELEETTVDGRVVGDGSVSESSTELETGPSIAKRGALPMLGL